MKMDSVVCNVEDMRQLLSREIQNLRQGSTTAHNLNAITNACGKMCQSAKLELEYAKAAGKKPHSTFIQ